jgi:hypothetical protein
MADEVGKYLPKGMAVGIEASADEVYNEMDKLSRNTLDIAADGLEFSNIDMSENSSELSGMLQIIIKLLKLILNKEDTTVLNFNNREVARALRELGVVFE